MSVQTGDVLWEPPADVLETTQVGRFLSWLREHRGVDLRDHEALWRWSVDDLDGFWSAVWDFFDVTDHGTRTAVLSRRAMPGAVWFPGSLLNYAEQALRGPGVDDDTVAVLGRSQSGYRSSLQNLRVLRDEKTIVEARAAAIALLADDPDLDRAPELHRRVTELQESRQSEFMEKS